MQINYDILGSEQKASLKRQIESRKDIPAKRKEGRFFHRCEFCYQPFRAARTTPKYCGQRCYRAAQRGQTATENVSTCVECGDEFRGKRRGAQYCSGRCRKAASRRQILKATKQSHWKRKA